ncbi:MAG: alpha/beta fold hydrolase [Anaerolineae bacterium]|nr:alpha/beta fold hydrolase [Anaerolineae bacterium]
MRKSKMTQSQILILAVLAVVDFLCIAGLGGTALVQTLQIGARAAVETPEERAPIETIPPTRALPPTWTPAPTATPQGADKLYTFELARCDFEVPVGANLACGYVTLPETRGETPSGMVKLAVAIYRSKGATPAPDPVIYLSGGPGGAAVADLALIYNEFIAPLQVDRDVIIFDQRGVGLSEPELSCYEYDNAAERDLEYDFGPDEQAEAYLQAFQRCRDRLTSRGINLAAYTSAANASDVRDLAEVLGYEQVNLYGISYGTRLALTVMRDHPDIVRSAVLDSVEPIEEPMFNGQAARTDRVLRKIFDGCAADKNCRATYPTLEEDFYALLERLDREPPTIWAKSPGEKMYKVQMDGDTVIAAIFLSSYHSSLTRYIPRMIDDAYQGDYGLAEWLVGYAAGFEDGFSIGMMMSVNCHEEIFATTPEQIAADFEAYGHVATFAYDAVYGEAETMFTICQEWGAAPFDSLEGQPVSSNIPALVLAGEYDPITPPAYSQQVAQRLSQSYYYEFPGIAHGTSIQAYCAYEIAKAFLNDPQTEPDGSCIADMGGIDFVR